MLFEPRRALNDMGDGVESLNGDGAMVSTSAQIHCAGGHRDSDSSTVVVAGERKNGAVSRKRCDTATRVTRLLVRQARVRTLTSNHHRDASRPSVARARR